MKLQEQFKNIFGHPTPETQLSILRNSWNFKQQLRRQVKVAIVSTDNAELSFEIKAVISVFYNKLNT